MAATNQPTDVTVNEVDPSDYMEQRKELEIDKIFRALVKLEGSDLHLKTGRSPIVRVDGTLRPLNRGEIDNEEMVRLIFPMLNKRTTRILEEDGGCDFAYVVDVDGVDWRFRLDLCLDQA